MVAVEGLSVALMFVAVTLLASISWDVWNIRRLLEGKRRAGKKHPREVERSPSCRLESEGERGPAQEVTQPLPKVAQRDPGRD